MEANVKNIDMVLIEHKDAGKVAAAYSQDKFWKVTLLLGTSKEIPETEVEGIYFPKENGGLKKVSKKEFKSLYKSVKALSV